MYLCKKIQAMGAYIIISNDNTDKFTIENIQIALKSMFANVTVKPLPTNEISTYTKQVAKHGVNNIDKNNGIKKSSIEILEGNVTHTTSIDDLYNKLGI
jgi:hypothetical protein